MSRKQLILGSFTLIALSCASAAILLPPSPPGEPCVDLQQFQLLHSEMSLGEMVRVLGREPDDFDAGHSQWSACWHENGNVVTILNRYGLIRGSFTAKGQGVVYLRPRSKSALEKLGGFFKLDEL